MHSISVVKTFHTKVNPAKKHGGTYTDHKAVDKGWRYFWAKRGFSPPPNVSTYTHGCFQMPTKLKIYESRN